MSSAANPQNSATIRFRRCPSQRRRNGLLRHAHNTTSQGGEDGIIARIFQLLPFTATRYCVDVGAWDGVHWSNTHSLLLSDQGWRGILIEASSERFIELQRLHEPLSNICIQQCVSCSKEGGMLSSLLRPFDFLPSNFDFLTIDVDGCDYWLFRDILLSGYYQPKVICVEFNPTMPHDLIYIPPQDDNVHHGCSLAALEELASNHNYVLVETTCYNAFFVQESIFYDYIIHELPWCCEEKKHPRKPTIEELHEITMGTQMYQLYDGTLKLTGCKKLLWHRLPIVESKIQMLNVKQRTFPFAPPQQPATEITTTANAMKNDNRIGMDGCCSNNEMTVVDMAPYCHYALDSSSQDDQDKSSSQAHCAKQLIDQLQQLGFAYVKGTGISSLLCQQALHQTHIFLNTASEKVRQSCISPKEQAHKRGYSPQNTENFASLLDDSDTATPNDLVRKFRIGPPTIITDDKSFGSNNNNNYYYNYTVPQSSSNNIWPDAAVWGEENVTLFRTAIETYYNHVCLASNQIVRAICDGLVSFLLRNCHGSAASHKQVLLDAVQTLRNSLETLVPMQSITDNGNTSTSILTCLGYHKGARHHPGKNMNKNRPLVAAHTDVGVITMLLFDQGNAAVLQRISSQDNPGEKPEWINVVLPSLEEDDDPCFVINVGDCLSELCGKILPSTLHRVMPVTLDNKTSTPRNCLAMFAGVAPDTVLSFPSLEEEEAARNMTYEEWRKYRVTRAVHNSASRLKLMKFNSCSNTKESS